MGNQSTGVVSGITAPAGQTTTGVGPWIKRTMSDCSVQVNVEGTGQVDAVVDVEVSNGPDSNPIACSTAAATVTLSGNPRDGDGFLMVDANWKWIRLNVTFLTGPGAKVTGLMGV